MPTITAIAKALGDPSRLQAVAALRDGELCLCHLIVHLHLAPSTVSKHMDLLYRSGLVTRRKQGRWHYFKLADQSASPMVQDALRWCLAHLPQEGPHQQEQRELRRLRKLPLAEVCACYR